MTDWQKFEHVLALPVQRSAVSALAVVQSLCLSQSKQLDASRWFWHQSRDVHGCGYEYIPAETRGCV